MKCPRLSNRAFIRVTMTAAALMSCINLAKAQDAPTFYAAAEMPWLQVQNSAYSSDWGREPHFGQQPSLRLWGGFESGDGLGFRASYWDFEDNTGLQQASSTQTVGQGVDVYAVDLEATQRARFHRFGILASGGVRFGGLENSRTYIDTTWGSNGKYTSDFDGAGLTFGLGWDRQIGSSFFNLYGKFRGSILFGDTDQHNTYSDIWGSGEDNSMIANQSMLIWETQLGLAYNHATRYGNLFGRVGVEGQVWDVQTGRSLGFFGPTFALGFMR